MTGGVARLAPTHPIEVLREQIAPDASDAELAHFAQVCARLDLSPFADQIVLIGRYNSRLRKTVFRHQITVAGRRTLAVRTGRLAGIEGPVWCGPRPTPDAPLVWQEVWDQDSPPYCARVLVHVHGWTVPANGTAKWDEFAQTDSNGTTLPLWRQMPSHMLGKVAESMALRRAFPDVIDPAIDADYPVPVQPDDGDLAELAEANATAPDVVDTDSAVRIHAQPAGDWRPSLDDQGNAHRIIGAQDDDSIERFLADWRIDDFTAAWPAEAVADALARRP